MISQAPQLRIQTNTPIGNDIFFALPAISNNPQSFIEADVNAGVTSLTANGSSFSVNSYLVFGQPGREKTEIVQVATVSATTVTLQSATLYPHNRGDVLILIEYNQIVPERSTDSGSTFSVLATLAVNPQFPETYLQRTGDATTDIYRYRFYNSTSALYSGYSNNATASGYADNTMYAIKKRALTQMGEKITDLITDDFLNDALNEGRRVVDKGTGIVNGESVTIQRWTFRTSFDTAIGQVIPGRYSVAAPTNLRDKNSYKNILSLRIGRQNWPCVYQDKNRFNQNYLNVAHTTLNGAITSGSTTITLTSSGNFDTAGNIYVAAESVSGTKDAVAYTANNLSTNVLSGVTGITSGGHATGRDVWQQATFGIPSAYNIADGMIYFDVPFDDRYAGEQIFSDYYKDLTTLTADSDTLDEPFYDLYVPYLKAKIKSLKSNGGIDITADSDYKLFQQGLNELIGQEVLGQNVYFVPDVWGSLNGGGGRGLY